MIKKILLGLVVLIALLLIGGYAYYRYAIYQPPLITEEDRAAIHLMPLPAKLEIKKGALDLSNGLQVKYSSFKNDKIENSVDRFLTRLSSKTGRNGNTQGGIILEISCEADSPNKVQQVVEDESYRLNIDTKEILLKAPGPYGIMHGLETILQLVEIQDDSIFLPGIEIEDKPRFPWRGIMLDVCRHWMPKEVILRTLDAMPAVKMNVFHWHLTEDQGFRVESKVYPKLHEYGSNGKYYTQEEIREVVQYAADRGIRIVPEFDLPGHSKSWQIAYPELSTVDYPLDFGNKKGEIFAPPLDPTKEEVYEFLDNFIEEMVALFPDPYLHIGGDEVNPKFWDESESVQLFMHENSLNDHHDLQAYFNSRMYEILKKHGKQMIGWEEIQDSELGNDIVIQSWQNQRSLFEGVQSGRSAILSTGYYLDHKLHAEKHYRIDPLVLPGAVDIEPDTSHWKMYDLVMELPMGDMDAQMVIFDRDPQNIYGFFAIMESRNAFKSGTLNQGTLNFDMATQMGELSFRGEFIGDSILGKLSFGLLNFPAFGLRMGGSDLAGTQMPKIEIIRSLTDEEKTRIFGGEAALWSEVVNAENVDSRLWPRSAAIAEKLWSPQELTGDIEDMYRRLPYISHHLTQQGAMHEVHYEIKLNKLIDQEGFDYLKTLVDVLEEVKYYNRLSMIMELDEVYLPDLPLDRVVDAAKPESLYARSFNAMVDEYLADSLRTVYKDQILQQLQIWSANHELLQSYIDQSEKLKDIEKISYEFSSISKLCLEKLSNSGTNLLEPDSLQIANKLIFLDQGDNGVLLAVTPGLRRLLMEM